MKRRTLLETGYGALRDLVLAGIDGDESDWPGIGYPGPLTPPVPDPIDDPIGFKLEAPPLHPALFAVKLPGRGPTHAGAMKRLAHIHALLAPMRDGFSPRSPGGSLRLRDDGTPVPGDPRDALVLDGARRALRAMPEIRFAAGARTVTLGREPGPLA